MRSMRSREFSTVPEAAGDAAVEFDQAVTASGSAVVGAAGVEVAQERVAPLFQGASEAGDLGDRAAGEAGQDRFGQGPALGWGVGVIDGPEALGALPGDMDLVVALVGGDRLGEPVLLPVGQVLGAGAENVADPVGGSFLRPR